MRDFDRKVQWYIQKRGALTGAWKMISHPISDLAKAKAELAALRDKGQRVRLIRETITRVVEEESW